MSDSWVEEVFQLVGRASRCWTEEGGKGVFCEQDAIAIADRLCEIVREQRADVYNLFQKEKPRTRVSV